jgi:hypothetical protein
MEKLIRYTAVAVFLCVCAMAARAQVLTLTPSVTSGNGTLSTRLTWLTTPAAPGCTASGHASWTGAKAASGTQDLPPITLSGTYQLTLACTWPGDNTATVRWTAPTTNTDGSALTNLAAFHVYRRLNNPDMNGGEMTLVRDPAATSFRFTNLPAGTHYFAVEAVNANGVPSELSNVASKVISATVSRSESVTVTVNPKPSATTITLE